MSASLGLYEDQKRVPDNVYEVLSMMPGSLGAFSEW